MLDVLGDDGFVEAVGGGAIEAGLGGVGDGEARLAGLRISEPFRSMVVDIRHHNEQGSPAMTATSTTVTTPRRPSRPRRGLWRVGALSVLAAIGLGLTSAPAASADVSVAGVGIHTSIDCGGSSMLVASDASADVSAYAMAYLYDYSTGTWIHEQQWHAVSSWSMVRTADFTFTRAAYFYVYMSYAVWGSGGWQYSGEFVTGYSQNSAAGTASSSTCLMGN